MGHTRREGARMCPICSVLLLRHTLDASIPGDTNIVSKLELIPKDALAVQSSQFPEEVLTVLCLTIFS